QAELPQARDGLRLPRRHGRDAPQRQSPSRAFVRAQDPRPGGVRQMNAVIELRDYRMKSADVPETVTEVIPAAEREALKARIRRLLAEQDAVLVAHYYTDADLQILAEETGGHVSDSLDM